MATDLRKLRRHTAADIKPSITVFYAPHGLGKTSFAAGAPAPVFIQTEDGLGEIEADTFGLLKSYDEVMDCLRQVYEEPEIYETHKTLCVDSMGWLEPLIWEKVKIENKWNDKDFLDYGRGYAAALTYWRMFFDGCSMIRNDRNMGIVLLTHVETRKIEPPDADSYTRYQPKLHKQAMAKLNEYADEILFMNDRVSVVKEDEKDKNSRKRGVGIGKRVVYTTGRPAWEAKNRWRMPTEIMVPDDPTKNFLTVAQHIPYYRNMMGGGENAVIQQNNAA